MQVYSAGPSKVWVRFPQDQSAVSFGTCERTPRVRRLRYWEGVRNDLGGTQADFDTSYQGEEVLVGVTLTRFRWAVLARLCNAPFYFGPPARFGGTALPGDIGTLAAQEGAFIEVFVQFEYGFGANAKVAMTNGGMPFGYRLACATWHGPDEEELGTAPAKVTGLFYGRRLYDAATGRFTAWDQNLLPIVGQTWEASP